MLLPGAKGLFLDAPDSLTGYYEINYYEIN